VTAIVVSLFLFVTLGLSKERLGRFSYILMAIVVVAFVAYTYHKPQ